MKYLFIINNHATKAMKGLLACFVAMLFSCSHDILNKEPLDSISQDAVFSDPVFLQNYVYNVYNGIRPPGARYRRF
jgi:hypothetical protein